MAILTHKCPHCLTEHIAHRIVAVSEMPGWQCGVHLTGKELLVSTSLAIAAEMTTRIGEALKQIEAEGKSVPAPTAAPERVERYNANRETGNSREGPVVLIYLLGDRSSQFFGMLTATDAKRLGSLLMAEAERTETPQSS